MNVQERISQLAGAGVKVSRVNPSLWPSIPIVILFDDGLSTEVARNPRKLNVQEDNPLWKIVEEELQELSDLILVMEDGSREIEVEQRTIYDKVNSTVYRFTLPSRIYARK